MTIAEARKHNEHVDPTNTFIVPLPLANTFLEAGMPEEDLKNVYITTPIPPSIEFDGPRLYKSGQICIKCHITTDKRFDEWSDCTINRGNGRGAEGHTWNRNPITL